jgi:anti-sigma B factor antagonist
VIAQSEDRIVIKVVGELDLDTAPQLRTVLVSLARQGAVHVTLDLAGMTFVDSTGLAVFVTGLKRLRQAGGDLALHSPSATAMKVLTISGLTSVFAISEEAVCATGSGEDAVRTLTA